MKKYLLLILFAIIFFIPNESKADTFGYTTAGASSAQVTNNDSIKAYIGTPTVRGTLDSIKFYSKTDAFYKYVKGVLFNTSGGTVAVGDEVIWQSETPVWKVSTTSSENITNGTTYWIAMFMESYTVSGSKTAFYYNDSGSGTNGKYSNNLGTSQYPTVPSPWTPQGETSIYYSIYGTYTPFSIDSNYVSRRPIVIDKDLVASSTGEIYTDFPFLVSETEDYLKATSSGGTIQHAAGWDIEFTSDTSTSTKLYHQIDTYEPTTGKLAAWVSLPTLSTSTDTTIYMWYNNSSVTASTEDPLEVWTTNYTWVHHLTGTTDSSANSRNLSNLAGTPTATSTGGQIGGAYIYDGNDAHYNSTDYLSYFSTSVATIEAWVKQTGTPPTVAPSLWSGDPIISNLGAEIGLGSWNNAGGNKFGALNYDGNADYVHATSTNDNWTHLVLVHTGGNVYLYQDGVSKGSAASGNTTDEASTSYLLLAGSPSGGGQYFVGSIDEVRVSNVARSADWINTEWCNQAGSGTCAFYALGADELAEEGGATPASYYIIDID